MSKFLLAENPIHPDQSGVWVIHTQNPKAMIQCFQGIVKTEAPHQHFAFLNSDRIVENWTLSAFHLFTTDFLTEPELQAEVLLKKAWRWYRAYMEWEDAQINEHE